MISVEQIRAARALLGWSQGDLSQHCGISTTSINTIERGEVAPRTSSRHAIARTLSAHGVLFTGAYGVDLQKDLFRVDVWEGFESIERYLIDVVETVKGTNDVPLHFNFNDELWVKQGHGPAYHRFFDDMIRYGIREKVLVREGDLIRYAPYETSEYRWFPKELSGQIGYSLYGNKYAIFTVGEVKRVIVIESPLLVETYRQQFLSLWDIAKAQPKVEPLYN